MLNEWRRMPILHESRWEWGMMRCVGRNLREMVLVVFNFNTRDRSPGSGSHFLHTATQFLRSVTQSLRGLLRRHSVYCFGLLAGLTLSACGGCATPQPLGVSCRAFSTGQVMSRGMAEGPTSIGESRGVRETRVICSLIYSREELEAELGQDEQ